MNTSWYRHLDFEARCALTFIYVVSCLFSVIISAFKAMEIVSLGLFGNCFLYFGFVWWPTFYLLGTIFFAIKRRFFYRKLKRTAPKQPTWN